MRNDVLRLCAAALDKLLKQRINCPAVAQSRCYRLVRQLKRK